MCFPEAYLEEADESGIRFFYRGCELYHPCTQKQGSEQIVTLGLRGGELISYEEDGEIISGKTLQVTEHAVTLEEQGEIPFGEVCEGYYQKEEVHSSNTNDIPIGYTFTDYLIKDGKICAFLILPKERMEYIRVAIQQSDYRGLYHKEVVLQSSEELMLSYLENGERKEESATGRKKACPDTGYRLSERRDAKGCESDQLRKNGSSVGASESGSAVLPWKLRNS